MTLSSSPRSSRSSSSARSPLLRHFNDSYPSPIPSPPIHSPPTTYRQWFNRVLATGVLFTAVYTLISIAGSFIEFPVPEQQHLNNYSSHNRTNTSVLRAWHEPDFALVDAPQPHTYTCSNATSSPLIFLGVFSAISSGRPRRDLYRQTVMNEYPKDLMTVRFILAKPRLDNYPAFMRDSVHARIMETLQAEIDQYNDIVVLDTIDNMDDGKTHTYLQYLAKTYTHSPDRPQFVLKADDDTVFAVPNLVAAFKTFNCNANLYFGTTKGANPDLMPYMRGLAYGLSWPLVAWLGNVELSAAHVSLFEDARTGEWLRHLDPLTDPVERVDLGWAMGDWNQVHVTSGTVALHYLKLDRWFVTQHERIRSAWEDEGRDYDVGSAVPLNESVALGAREPGIQRNGVLWFCVSWRIVWACNLVGLEEPWYTDEYMAKAGLQPPWLQRLFG